MRLQFTTRKPQPRSSAVAPLKDGNPPEATASRPQDRPRELGGPSGPEPTRYGDWERKGICVDF